MSSIDDKLDFNLSDEQKRIVFENLDDNKKPAPLNDDSNIKIVIQSKVSKNYLIKFI